MIAWDTSDAYKLDDWMIYFVETVFKPLFCEYKLFGLCMDYPHCLCSYMYSDK